MSKSFDIGIESLAGGATAVREGRHGHLGSFAASAPVGLLESHKSAVDSDANSALIAIPSDNKKSFYIETFGCQMNEHDSEKVSGVLLGRGYRQVETIDEAGLVLYNTCSIREKAAQKIFSRLGAYRKYPGEEKIIGVLGCVAQQEGEEIFERSPWV